MNVALFFMPRQLGGGSTTYTAHLYKALQMAGAMPCMYRVRSRSEEKWRPFGQYAGVSYRNVSVEEATHVVRSVPSLMTAAAHSRYLPVPQLITMLVGAGMRVVVHDPNEFKVYDHLTDGPALHRPICIRPTMLPFLPSAQYIPHPYMSVNSHARVTAIARTKLAISVARVASVKRPHIILEANRLLAAHEKIELCGAEHRLYTRGLAQRYPDEFQQSGKTFKFPLTFNAPVQQCAAAYYNVDMTYFPDDGGGTQYAMLEAMDAGTVNIMHQDWFRYPGSVQPGKHVLVVHSAGTLALLVRQARGQLYEDVRAAGYALLRQHNPILIGQQYLEELKK